MTPASCNKLRELAMAALATASGEWTVSDTNEDDVQRPTRFAGPVVVYAADDCDIHPIADCSCNHTCRDEDQQRDIAAYIAAVHPGAIIELLDAVEKAEAEADAAKVALSSEVVEGFRENLQRAREVQQSVVERQASIRAGARRAPKRFKP